jgi:hypothetical protein
MTPAELRRRAALARSKGAMHAVAIWPDDAERIADMLDRVPTWIEAEQLPDSDIEVIVLTKEGETLPAFHDGDCWRDLTAMPIAEHQVVRWTMYPEPCAQVMA